MIDSATKKHRGYEFDFVLVSSTDDHEAQTIRESLTHSDARFVLVVKRPIYEAGVSRKTSPPKFFSFRGFIYYDSPRYPTQLIKILPSPTASRTDDEAYNPPIIRSAPTGKVVMSYSPNSRKDVVWLEHNKDNVPRGFRLIVDDENYDENDDEESDSGGEEDGAIAPPVISNPIQRAVSASALRKVHAFGCEDTAFLKDNDALLSDMLKRQYGGPRRYAELVFCDGRTPQNQTVRYRPGDDDNLYVCGQDGCWVRWNRDMITETIVTNAWTLIVGYYDELLAYPERLKEFRSGLSLPSLTFERIRDFVKDFREWMKNGQLPFMFADVQQDVWRVIRKHWEPVSEDGGVPPGTHPPCDEDREWLHEAVLTADQVLEMHLRGHA